METEKRPEPLRVRAFAVMAMAAAVHALVVKGWIPQLDSGTEQAIAAGLVDLAGAYITWRWSRPHLTPTADPRLSESRRLVPAGPDGLSPDAKLVLLDELVGVMVDRLAAGSHPSRGSVDPFEAYTPATSAGPVTGRRPRDTGGRFTSSRVAPGTATTPPPETHVFPGD